MEYLLYVEHNAELLQFYLWYCGYIQRWTGLWPQQKALSPPWTTGKHQDDQRLKLLLQSHQRKHSDKLIQVLKIMETRTSTDGIGLAISDESDASTAQAPKQPLRDELNNVISHYIEDGAPRRLQVPDEDIEACQAAVQTTTHPSALLPAFIAADTSLRTSSHPKFIHWSQQNANRPRLEFSQVLGGFLVLLGLTANMLFIMSSVSQFYRITCLALWWPGFIILISAFQGVCVFLHIRNLRQLRPWEHLHDERNAEKDDPRNSAITTVISSANDQRHRKHARTVTAASTTSRIDGPLQTMTIQPFGPSNDFDQVEQYARRPVFKKIFDEAAKTQNTSIRLLRDRVLFFAVCWGGLVSTILAVGSLFIPCMKLF